MKRWRLLEKKRNSPIEKVTLERKFNINENVKIKLTDSGIKMYKEYYKGIKNTAPRLDKDGYYRDQLWHIIKMFGSNIGMCCELPFETEIIIL
jgi:hypothetical protein